MEENNITEEKNQRPEIDPAKKEDNIKAVIEALLFSSERPLMVDQIRKVLDNMDAEQIRKKAEELKADYEHQNRGMRIFEIAGGFQMIASPVFATFLRKLHNGPQHADKLSKQALLTLAIIAYKQPLSKMEVETLRKVNVDAVMSTLLDKNLIRVTGRKKAPGRPKVYGTTRQFLEYFGLKSLDDLPKIESYPLPAQEQQEQIEKIEESLESKQEEMIKESVQTQNILNEDNKGQEDAAKNPEKSD